jgi:hypothetical protein
MMQQRRCEELLHVRSLHHRRWGRHATPSLPLWVLLQRRLRQQRHHSHSPEDCGGCAAAGGSALALLLCFFSTAHSLQCEIRCYSLNSLHPFLAVRCRGERVPWRDVGAARFKGRREVIPWITSHAEPCPFSREEGRPSAPTWPATSPGLQGTTMMKWACNRVYSPAIFS